MNEKQDQLRADWDQAWTQARHLESMRGQWLGFYFTAVLGTVALAAPRVNPDSPRSLAAAAAVSVVLDIVAATLYLAVVRLNAVHRYYDQVIWVVRSQVLRDSVDQDPLRDLDRLLKSPRDGLAGRLTTTKYVSETVLLLGVLGAALVTGAVASRAVVIGAGDAAAFALVGLGLGLCLAFFCVWAVHPRVQNP